MDTTSENGQKTDGPKTDGPKTAVFEMRIDADFARTPQGRASFILGMAQFAREGNQRGATDCQIDLVPLRATWELFIQCTFREGKSFDWLYPRATQEDRSVFFLDLVMTALERHIDHPSVAPLWGPRPCLVKADIAEKLADVNLNEK